MQFKPYTDYVRDLAKRLAHIRSSHKSYREFKIKVGLYVSDARTLFLAGHVKENGKVRTNSLKRFSDGSSLPVNDVVFWKLVDEFLSKKAFLAYKGADDIQSIEEMESIITDDYQHDFLMIEQWVDEKGTYDKEENMLFIGFDTDADVLQYSLRVQRPDVLATERLVGIQKFYELR